jgi:dienelactone hydrolase
LEQMSFGYRNSAPETYASCQRDSMAALMLGETMIGIRTYDAMCAVDFLASQPSVDPERVAIAGISGGGLSAYWAACFEKRIAAVMVSGYLNTFQDSILSIEHCVDNYAPGLAEIVEMPDMAALIAPRKLFAENGDEDLIFPPAAFLGACKTVEEIYADAGAKENFDFELFPGGHQFWGRKGIPKMQEWMGLV